MRRAVLVGLMGLALPQAASADDLARGRELFEDCRSCHSRKPGETGLPGPNLAGLAGRKVGADPDYAYSPALEKARDAGEVWTRERLEAFLADPAAMYPGLWMASHGIVSPADRAALAAFLMSDAPQD